MLSCMICCTFHILEIGCKQVGESYTWDRVDFWKKFLKTHIVKKRGFFSSMEPDWFPSVPPWSCAIIRCCIMLSTPLCVLPFKLCVHCCVALLAMRWCTLFGPGHVCNAGYDNRQCVSMWAGQDFFMLVDATGDECVTGISEDSKGLNEFLILRLFLWRHLLFFFLLGLWFVFNCTKLTLGVSQPPPSYMLASWPAWAGHPEAITGPLVAQLEGFNKSL